MLVTFLGQLFQYDDLRTYSLSCTSQGPNPLSCKKKKSHGNQNNVPQKVSFYLVFFLNTPSVSYF